MDIDRDPFFFGPPDQSLSGWFHRCAGAPARGVAVLCPPFGSEHTQSHRTLRRLADRLARQGVPTLRFDYHGTGDSPGAHDEPARLARWRRDILAAIAEARRSGGGAAVCLVGLRLGATLAALVSREIEVDALVAWHPYAKGRLFTREMQAIARTAGDGRGPPVEGGIECAGYFLSNETLADVAAIDLAAAPPAGRCAVLAMPREELQGDIAWAKAWSEAGLAVDVRPFSGWVDLVTDEHDSLVPEAALDSIVEWVASRMPATPVATVGPAPAGRQSHVMDAPPGPDGGVPVEARIEERLVRFGREANLFGVLCAPAGRPARGPAVALINAGSVHHVGPHRTYVELARTLAGAGVATFRFDIEGIGDSVLAGPGTENHPYPSWGVDSVRQALDALGRETGTTRFVLAGLCSGAYHVFQAGLATRPEETVGLLMINPLTFYWKEGSRVVARQFAEAHYYGSSVRDPKRWLKVLKLQVDIRRPAKVMLAQARTMARSRLNAWLERFAPARGPQLSRDLRKILAGRPLVAFVISDSDPGRDILMAGARYAFTRALADGALFLHVVADADHTFTRRHPRGVLAAHCLALLSRLEGTPVR